MTDLAAWLLEQLVEDEAVAAAATPGPWSSVEWYPGSLIVQSESHAEGVDMYDKHQSRNIAQESARGDIFPADAEHIARHDPARVLAECAARRQLVELHALFMAWGKTPVCKECGPDEDEEFQAEVHGRGWPCKTLRILAQPYAAEPDFDPAWRLDQHTG